jgi:MFS family permease
VARMTRGERATLAAGTLAMAASGPGQSFGLAVFTDDLIAGTATTRTSFSVFYAAATVASVALASVIGSLIDRVGPRAVWVVASTGLAAALVLLSVSAGPLVLVPALCAARALGQGTMPLLGTVVTATGFPQARGRMVGLAAQGLTASGVLLPPLAVALIDGFGWRAALRIIAAVLVLVVLPLGAVLLRDAHRAHVDRAQNDRVAVPRVRGVWVLALCLAVPPLTITALVVHAVAVGRQAGVSTGVAALAVSSVSIGSALGALIGGRLGDRLGPGFLLGALGAAIAAGPLLVLAGGPAVLLGYAVCGAAGGLVLVANGSLWAEAYGQVRLATRQGRASAVQIAGAAIGPLPPAISLSLTGASTAALLSLAGLGVVSLALGRRWLSVVGTGPRAASSA